MTSIYRVEHKDNGYGPYIMDEQGGAELEVLYQGYTRHQDYCDCHPSPTADGLIKWRSDIEGNKFAFEKISDLKKWFSGLGVALHKSGYVVAKYDVPDVDVVRRTKGWARIGYDNRKEIPYSGQVMVPERYFDHTRKLNEYSTTGVIGRGYKDVLGQHTYDDYMTAHKKTYSRSEELDYEE